MELVVVSSRSDKFSFRSCEIPVPYGPYGFLWNIKSPCIKVKRPIFNFFSMSCDSLCEELYLKSVCEKKRTNSGYLVLDIHSRTIWLVNDFVRMTRLRNSLGGLQCRLYIVDSTLYSTDSTVHRLQLTMMLMATVCLLNIRIIISMHSDNI